MKDHMVLSLDEWINFKCCCS